MEMVAGVTGRTGTVPWLAAFGLTGADVDAAIRKIEQSRNTHEEWYDHLGACAHCQEHPPEHVHGRADQQRIMAEYDRVLRVLRAARQDVAQATNTVTFGTAG